MSQTKPLSITELICTQNRRPVLCDRHPSGTASMSRVAHPRRQEYLLWPHHLLTALLRYLHQSCHQQQLWISQRAKLFLKPHGPCWAQVFCHDGSNQETLVRAACARECEAVAGGHFGKKPWCSDCDIWFHLLQVATEAKLPRIEGFFRVSQIKHASVGHSLLVDFFSLPALNRFDIWVNSPGLPASNMMITSPWEIGSSESGSVPSTRPFKKPSRNRDKLSFCNGGERRCGAEIDSAL